MNTNSLISGPLNDAYSWKLDSSNRFVGTYLGLVEHTFRDEDINVYHPKLAESFRAFLQFKYSQNIKDPWLGREQAIAMYMLQVQDPIEVRDIYGSTRQILEVKAIFNEDDHPIVNIRGTVVEIMDITSTDGGNTRSIYSVIDGGLDIFKIDLESMYPGWEERWDIGIHLGVPLDELARQVFSRSPIQSCLIDMGSLGDF